MVQGLIQRPMKRQSWSHFCGIRSTKSPILFASSKRWLTSKGRDQLRVAIAGGGVAGLSAALHLAPLVEEGLIASPIDIFDVPDKEKKDRDIGVGLWTTALDALAPDVTTRPSHQTVYEGLTKGVSTWLDYVGYRTPNGRWLMQSQLPGSLEEHLQTKFPGLLFQRERDLLGLLQKAVHWEEQLGTLQVHRGLQTQVAGIAHDEWWVQGQMQHPFSAKLELTKQNDPAANPINSERDYHLIVAADGTFSNLRQKYGGIDAMMSSSAGALSSPSMDVSLSSTAAANSSSVSWDSANHQEAVGTQDRHYTVFRGNARITSEQLNEIDPHAILTGGDSSSSRASFQTWGTHNSMRFATVPMFCPVSKSSDSGETTNHDQKTQQSSKQEHQVWFITVNDPDITQETDPQKRVDMLLNGHFQAWHSPIAEIVRATDPSTILVDRAIAHRHCMGPVSNMNRVLQRLESDASRIGNVNGSASTRDPDRPYAGGPGPALVFLGDAMMTVDPILAQGFTMAMEGSANLQESVRRALKADDSVCPPPLNFDPYGKCRELVLRYARNIFQKSKWIADKHISMNCPR